MALRRRLAQSVSRPSKHLLFALALCALPSAIGCAADSGPASDAISEHATQAQYAPKNPIGTWTFQGFAGKCLDVGGWPTRNGTLAMIYTCNGTAAQVITVAPANDARTEFEIRADGRCLTMPSLTAGAPILLSRCDDTRSQRFMLDTSPVPGPRFRAADAQLVISVDDMTGNDRTPLTLQGYRPVPDASINDTQMWTLVQLDTTPYTQVAQTPQTGTVELVGLANKCLDVGAGPYPAIQPAMLYGCNGTIAQRFQIVPVAGTRSDVEIHANGRCLEVTSGTPVVRLPPGGTQLDRIVATTTTNFAYAPAGGSDVALTACGGRATQRFGIETFDATYIFPSGHPELAIGVRGTSSADGSVMELKGRGTVASDMWRIVQEEGTGYAPLLPKVSIGRATVRDHRNGADTTTIEPVVTIQDQSRTETKLSVLYRRLGSGAFTELFSTGTLADVGTTRFAALPFASDDTYEMKVHAEGPGGIAESVPFEVDTRTPRAPWSVAVSSIEENQVLLSWSAAGAPFVDDFDITWDNGAKNVTVTGTGQQSRHQVLIDGLQSNTKYRFIVRAHNDLWGTSDIYNFSWIDVTTSGSSSGGGGGGGGGGTPSSITICGTGISSCPAGFHPGAFVRTLACGDTVDKDATQCDPNAGLSFNSCGEPNCPSGFHPVRFQYAVACDLQTINGSIDPNESTCAPDNADFTMCGSCPFGYSTTGLSTNVACDGYQQSHCHQN